MVLSVAAGDGSAKSYKCSSWRWVRQSQVSSVAAGDGSGWSQVTSAAAGDGSGWSQV